MANSLGGSFVNGRFSTGKTPSHKMVQVRWPSGAPHQKTTNQHVLEKRKPTGLGTSLEVTPGWNVLHGNAKTRSQLEHLDRIRSLQTTWCLRKAHPAQWGDESSPPSTVPAFWFAGGAYYLQGNVFRR
jgi:hypothetical protein